MRLAVFVGTKGRGSNLLAIHTAIAEGRLSAQIAVVVGTRADAPALERAQELGHATAVVAFTKDDPAGYSVELLAALDTHRADAIALAGYLRKLPEALVERFAGRIVNIHPALLPSFGGKGMYGHHVHEAVLAHGCKLSGCTAHLVDADYDTGPIVIQKAVAVAEDDTPETLAARILPLEHAALVEALQLLATNRLRREGRRLQILPEPVSADGYS